MLTVDSMVYITSHFQPTFTHCPTCGNCQSILFL